MSKIVPISFHAVFQFHYGTIKSLPHPRSPNNNSYFNSTMVRLKGVALVDEDGRALFQFHYGTIKSLQPA